MKNVKALTVCLIFFSVALTGSLSAQEAPSTSNKKVVAFVKQYVKAFNTGDVSKVAACFHFPHSQLNQNQPFRVINNQNEMELESFYEMIKTNFQWKENEVTKIRVLYSTDEKACVQLTMNGVDQNGNAFAKVIGILGLAQVDGKWGFAQVSWHFPPAE